MNVTIVGLGLIGGSLGLALRQSTLGGTPPVVTGWDRAAQTIAAAQTIGAIDRGATTLAEAVREAALVIVATPVLAVRAIFEVLAPQLAPGTIVTDVASTKVQVLQWARELLPPGVAFVGGHPMAGSEQHGIASARADLLRGAVYCLTALEETAPAALASVEAMVTSVGGRPLWMGAEAHDASVAAISHLPFLLSAALVQLTASDPHWPALGRLAATGYRDVTRLASGDPAMHRDICLTNAPAIRERLHELSRLLAEVAEHLEDAAYLEALFGTAQDQREIWLRERIGVA